MKLSLCIATFNEEKNIHIPLDSAYEMVDEVVIVDGGSTDKTIEIAKAYGEKIKIFHEKNPPMFHLNKQKAIEAANGEWILQLDADEALSEDLKKEIATLLNGYIAKNNNVTIQQFNNEITGFYIPRKNWFLTRFLTKGGQYPDYTIRLYKNGSAKFPCRDVHENVQIINSNNQIPRNKQISKSNHQNSNKFGNSNLNIGNCLDACNLKIGYLKSPILHYADPDFSRYLMRWNRYTTLEVENMKKSVIRNPSFLNYFIVKPCLTFFMMYFRHLGLMDGFPGFVFSLFSALRFWVIYIKYWTITNKKN